MSLWPAGGGSGNTNSTEKPWEMESEATNRDIPIIQLKMANKILKVDSWKSGMGGGWMWKLSTEGGV